MARMLGYKSQGLLGQVTVAGRLALGLAEPSWSSQKKSKTLLPSVLRSGQTCGRWAGSPSLSLPLPASPLLLSGVSQAKPSCFGFCLGVCFQHHRGVWGPWSWEASDSEVPGVQKGSGQRLVSLIVCAASHLTTPRPGSASQRPWKVRTLRSGKFCDLPKVTGSESSNSLVGNPGFLTPESLLFFFFPFFSVLLIEHLPESTHKQGLVSYPQLPP